MFGPLPRITLIMQILKLLNNPINIPKTDFSYGKPCILIFFDLLIVLRPREEINPFTYLTK